MYGDRRDLAIENPRGHDFLRTVMSTNIGRLMFIFTFD
jgi:hypothetical protein